MEKSFLAVGSFLWVYLCSDQRDSCPKCWSESFPGHRNLLGTNPSISSMKTSWDPAASKLGMLQPLSQLSQATPPTQHCSSVSWGSNISHSARASLKGASCQPPAKNAHPMGIGLFLGLQGSSHRQQDGLGGFSCCNKMVLVWIPDKPHQTPEAAPEPSKNGEIK